MKYNTGITSTQNEYLIKHRLDKIARNTKENEQATIDNGEAIQWLIDNCVTVNEDGSVDIGTVHFTQQQIEALKALVE